jgi:multidrug resistance protein
MVKNESNEAAEEEGAANRLADQEKEGANVEDTPYTTFTPTQKRLLLGACSTAAVFSTISSFIYFPAITAIANSLRVSIEQVNWSITSYLIVSGIAPSVFGSLADDIGRRPVLLLTLCIYVGANIGLALTQHYATLIVMRCLQSAGASSTIAIAFGIIADISIPAERGSYVGVLMGATNAAPCLGPVIGGVVSEKLSWKWIFWLLVIVAGTLLATLTLFLPETERCLVGNGSLQPARLMNRSIYSLVSRRKTRSPAAASSRSRGSAFLGPFKSLSALRNQANFIVILAGGITYTVYTCLAASLSAAVIAEYEMNYLMAGLTYLPNGIGVILSSYASGKLLDHDYKVTARRLGFPVTSRSGNEFPFAKARLRSIFPVVIVSAVATMGYGWVLHTRSHIAILLVVQFFSGAAQVCIFATCGTLLTDLNPGRSSTVQASYSLVRCALSGAGVAALETMVRQIGYGWTFTVFGGLGLLCVPILFYLKQKRAL